MNPEQAWQAALMQLQQEMPKSAYDTWVQGAEFAGFSDGHMIVRVASAYARDWLTSRLTSTLNRMLCGILNQPVNVQFVTDEPPEDQSLAETDEEIIQIQQSVSGSLYRTYVCPDEGLRVPVYLLRWLPYVGPKVLFVYLALRYTAQDHQGVRMTCNSGPATFDAPYRLVQSLTGIDHETIKATVDDPAMGWFLERVEPEHTFIQDRQSGRTKRAPTRYRITAYAPLTPQDADNLNAFLRAHRLNDSPLTALEQALAAPPGQIFTYPIPSMRPSDRLVRPSVLTVQSVIRQALARRTDKSVISDCMEKADRLAERLVGREILISSYFLRNWSPLLRATPTMLIVLLRSYTYVNEQTGDIHDAVWIDGGLSELARILNVSLRTIRRLFPPSELEGERKPAGAESAEDLQMRDLVGRFIQRTTDGDRGSRRAWLFHVQREDPLTEADRQRHAQAYRLIFKVADRCQKEWDVDDVLELAEEILASQKGDKTRTSNRAESDIFRTSKNPLRARFRTSENEKSDSLRTSILEKSDKFRTSNPDAWNALITLSDLQALGALIATLKELFYPPPEVVETPDDTPLPECALPDETWDFRTLIERNVKAPQKRQALLERPGEGWAFVSWLLSATSARQGRGIVDPVSLAITHISSAANKGAGGVYDRLARLPARRLARMIIESLRDWPRQAGGDWQTAMGGTEQARLRGLADSLGVALPD